MSEKLTTPPPVPTENDEAENGAGTKKKKNKNEKTNEAEEIVRFSPDTNTGLTDEQAALRMEQGLNNSEPKKYSKTYGSIFFGNICTFFNFLCLMATVALILAHAPLSQFTFVVIFCCNIIVAIVQEIRATKRESK